MGMTGALLERSMHVHMYCQCELTVTHVVGFTTWKSNYATYTRASGSVINSMIRDAHAQHAHNRTIPGPVMCTELHQ